VAATASSSCSTHRYEKSAPHLSWSRAIPSAGCAPRSISTHQSPHPCGKHSARRVCQHRLSRLMSRLMSASGRRRTVLPPAANAWPADRCGSFCWQSLQAPPVVAAISRPADSPVLPSWHSRPMNHLRSTATAGRPNSMEDASQVRGQTSRQPISPRKRILTQMIAPDAWKRRPQNPTTPDQISALKIIIATGHARGTPAEHPILQV
jgi:hypothetical protein